MTQTTWEQRLNEIAKHGIDLLSRSHAEEIVAELKAKNVEIERLRAAITFTIANCSRSSKGKDCEMCDGLQKALEGKP
jgi:hypothetical protein